MEEFQDTQKWYEEFPKGTQPTKNTKPFSEILELKSKAEKSLNGEAAAYSLKQSKIRSSEYNWLKTALSKGTTSDKISASVIMVQDSPKHNLSKLTSLVSMVKLGTQHNSKLIISSINDLFLSDLLHPEFKLLKFEDQNFEELEKATNKNKLLAHWYYEDQLKLNYSHFIDSLTEIATSGLEVNKEIAVVTLTSLLKDNPEQEDKILSILVNKIGDPSAKVSSKVVSCLTNLLQEHPKMKGVVLKEVEKLLFRQNVPQRVQYYAICLLTQFVLEKNDNKTATYLIDVYFAFFKACLKKGEPQSKMMAAILAGVNRAYPYAKLEDGKIQEHIDSVYKVVHFGSFHVSMSALCLLFQVCSKNQANADRFYTAFYKKILDPEISSSNVRAVFLNLFYRVIREDKSIVRVAAFIKRILQVSLYFPANMSCAVLYSISQVIKSRKDLKRILTKKPVKIEIKDEVKDEVIQEEEESKIKGDKTDDEKQKKDNTEITIDDNDYDYLNDSVVEIKKEVEENNDDDKDKILLPNVVNKPAPADEENKPKTDPRDQECKLKPYDPFHRNPIFAGGYNASFMEILALLSHFHPSVSLFAKNIMEGKKIEYSGDPFEDLALNRFLDRYVFKNPKKLSESEKSRKDIPLAKRRVYVPKGMIRKMPVGSEAYMNIQESNIPADEQFMYRFLKYKSKDAVSKTKEDEEDLESVNSEEFNDMLENMAGVEEDDLDDLDIATDFADASKKNAKSGKKGKKENDDKDLDEEFDDEEGEEFDDEEGEDFDDDEDMEDGEMENYESDEDMDDFDDEDLANDFGSDDEASDLHFDDSEEEMEPTKKGGNKKKGNNLDMEKLGKLCKSAEKFSEMLEEQGSSKLKQGASNTLKNADGANFKQIKWEMDRNQKKSKKPQSGKSNKNHGKRLQKKQGNSHGKKRQRR